MNSLVWVRQKSEWQHEKAFTAEMQAFMKQTYSKRNFSKWIFTVSVNRSKCLSTVTPVFVADMIVGVKLLCCAVRCLLWVREIEWSVCFWRQKDVTELEGKQRESVDGYDCQPGRKKTEKQRRNEKEKCDPTFLFYWWNNKNPLFGFCTVSSIHFIVQIKACCSRSFVFESLLGWWHIDTVVWRSFVDDQRDKMISSSLFEKMTKCLSNAQQQ